MSQKNAKDNIRQMIIFLYICFLTSFPISSLTLSRFIDTSIESDLPPTLSNLRQNNNARKLSAQLSVRINEMNNFVINGATTAADLHDENKIANEFDSAMEYSSSSTTNNSSSLATEQVIMVKW